MLLFPGPGHYITSPKDQQQSRFRTCRGGRAKASACGCELWKDMEYLCCARGDANVEEVGRKRERVEERGEGICLSGHISRQPLACVTQYSAARSLPPLESWECLQPLHSIPCLRGRLQYQEYQSDYPLVHLLTVTNPAIGDQTKRVVRLPLCYTFEACNLSTQSLRESQGHYPSPWMTEISLVAGEFLALALIRVSPARTICQI